MTAKGIWVALRNNCNLTRSYRHSFIMLSFILGHIQAHTFHFHQIQNVLGKNATPLQDHPLQTKQNKTTKQKTQQIKQKKPQQNNQTKRKNQNQTHPTHKTQTKPTVMCLLQNCFKSFYLCTISLSSCRSDMECEITCSGL